MSDQVCFKETYLRYSSVDIYMTYSFVVDFSEFSFEKFVRTNINDWIPDPIESNDEKKKYNWTNYPTAPKDRQGVTPLLTVRRYNKMENAAVEYFPSAVWNRQEPESGKLKYISSGNEQNEPTEFSVNYESVIRLFCNGSGCVTFKISLPPKDDGTTYSWQEIKQVLALSRRTYTPIGVALLDESVLYQKFRKIIGFLEEKKEQVKLLCDSISNPSEVITDSASEQYGVSPQNPNTFIVIELEDDKDMSGVFATGKPEIQLSDERLEIHHELASLVLNIVPNDDATVATKNQINHIIIPERIRTGAGGLRNFAWDSRLFISCDRQTVLIAKCRNSSPPQPFIEYSLLDALEILRTRWHMSIVINALLDADLDRKKKDDSDANISSLEKLIARRKQFARFLNDPIPYRFIGGSVTDIVEHLEKQLWLERLRMMVFRKFEVLTSLSEDRLEYSQLRDFKEFRKQLSG